MKNKSLLMLVLGVLSGSLSAKDYLISTPNTSLLITANPGEKSKFQYYGSRISEKDIQGIYDSSLTFGVESYPVFGLKTAGERAMAVTHSDGNMTLDLVVENVRQYTEKDGDVTEIRMKDLVYPFILKQFFKAYKGTDVISTWVEVENNGKKPVTLHRFASAFFPVHRGDNWMTHFHGFWGAESTMEEEKLTNGQKVISNKDGLVNSESDNPSFLLSLDGRPQEEYGRVLGGTLAWTGTYLIKMDVKNTSFMVSAGINEETSHYVLDGKKTFVTPEFAMTYSTSGKGGVSRAFHRWARAYKLNRGNIPHDILLNSWEGVYFKVDQKEMDQMMEHFSAMGGELFVMDDGWFGNKYPRNTGSSSLGDWEVCKEKLPDGIEGLLESAKKHNIKFGIWIEPEMANTKSELFEQHPDWILRVANRPLSTGRGKTQVVLDLTNPEVQDFVFGVVDNLMTKYPEIAYMKWDDNCCLLDYGSSYLPKDRQSHIYIEYQRGLNKVLKRIRAKYPNLVMQACAGGGGRVNYGILPYFDEFWTSDNTDALQRIYLQWGISNFYPAIAMASHVSADKNHQTGRRIPLKFRFDVAMSGRLGMEIQPRDMTEEDKAFAKRAIASYKKVRSVVQLGDLYRLVSPYDRKGISSLMYVTPEKDRAVFYVYKIEHFVNMLIPSVRMNGLDAQKMYRLADLTAAKADKPCPLDGKVISGKVLMEEGVVLKEILKKEYSSMVLELQEVK
ncbi:alpha-galactosidase [Phocaeicola massiliensis]|uniref:alpha-galactosidase n=1 Tax=Phocaeicola massiliensis TaxID=204516 RepID=UPI002030760D|nr:alpha-galactosidase [Phocaeicola massiliensis]MCM1612921.1 alpha-galactosidase [Phocaeicola massiliensis]MCM1705388.1 alpha-galactosidase [Phocaeicola massiliensis]